MTGHHHHHVILLKGKNILIVPLLSEECVLNPSTYGVYNKR